MRTTIIALAVLVGILGGFYGGYKVGHSNASAATSSSSSSSQRSTGNAGVFAPGGRGANGAACPSPGSTPASGSTALARGTVTNLTATSMTVTNTSCIVTITFSPGTTVVKQVTGSTADLANNETVTVTGTRAADGSVTAVAIQIAPAGSFTRPGGGAPASPSPGG
ncbi:MAG TPA: hypothetical protein VGV88_01935 [Candidatus Dormibacteraeota bacterium]|nr:hypothetical protein [Candidatus Dormibacteraeota bacterium]